jgi:hypothetical protein
MFIVPVQHTGSGKRYPSLFREGYPCNSNFTVPGEAACHPSNHGIRTHAWPEIHDSRSDDRPRITKVDNPSDQGEVLKFSRVVDAKRYGLTSEKKIRRSPSTTYDGKPVTSPGTTRPAASWFIFWFPPTVPPCVKTSPIRRTCNKNTQRRDSRLSGRMQTRFSNFRTTIKCAPITPGSTASPSRWLT